MDALSAPLVHVHRSDLLWLVPAAPALGALARRVVGRRDLLAAVAPCAVALLVALSQIAGLLGLEVDARQLLAPGPTPLRVGTMELSLSLLLDPLAAVMVLAIAILAMVAQAHRAKDEADGHGPIDLAATGALLAVLADGFFGLLVGSAIAAAAIGFATARSPALARVGDLALLLAGVLLFWSLGGSWGISIGHEPTYTRRNPALLPPSDPLDLDDDGEGPSLMPVLIGAPPAPTAPVAKGALPNFDAKGTITVVGPLGARVFLKGGVQPTARAPVFQHQVFAGRMDIEIETDGRTPRRQRFRAVEVPPGRELALVTVGPTLGFRELREQLALTDPSRRRVVRDLLDPSVPGHRRLGRFDAGTLVALSLGLAALVPIASAALAGASLVAEALVPLVAVYLLARLGFFFTLSPSAGAAVAGAFALVAVLSALRAAVDHRTPELTARLLAAQLAIAAAGVALGAPSLGVTHALGSAFACAVVWTHLDLLGVRGLRRVSGAIDSAPRGALATRLGALALAGPLAGAAFTGETLLGRAFASELPYAKGIWALLVVAAVAIAVAAWRAYYAVFEGPRSESLEEPEPRVALALTLAAAAVLVLPPVLALSRGSALPFGGERSLVEAFLDPCVDPSALLGADRPARFRELGRGADLGALGLAVFASAAAWLLVRRRMRDEDRAKIAAREWALPSVSLAWLARLDELLFERPLAALVGLFVRRRP